MDKSVELNFQELIRLGDLETSTDSFVTLVKRDFVRLEQRIKEVGSSQVGIHNAEYLKTIRMVQSHFQLCETINMGIGYLSSSVSHDQEKEVLTAAIVAELFQKHENGLKPIVLPIDLFYQYLPAILGLVEKTLTFNYDASQQGIKYALLLTGFTKSKVFTEEVLTLVPTQTNAGLSLPYSSMAEFGLHLYAFSEKLPELMREESGKVSRGVRRIMGDNPALEDDAKLLVATGLLLQDKQTWQKLWYEGQDDGTPLFIVAPISFHHAMNRMNLGWGHGVCDYNYRARCSLGAPYTHLFGPITKPINYHDMGLSSKEFQLKVEPLLEKLK